MKIGSKLTNAPKPKKTAPESNRTLQTDGPLSERDEVKKAEARTQNLHKSGNKQ